MSSCRDLAAFAAVSVVVLGALPMQAAAQALVCAAPGSDPATNVSGIVNTYYAGNGNLASGATSLVLGARDTRGSSTPVVVGDLLLVIQMQDGSLNASNNSNYGSGTGNGQGTTSVGSAGRYEFVRVNSVAGAAITFSPALTHSYVSAAATGTTGQKRYQVVRAPQYANVTATGVTAPAWGGTIGAEAGGVVVMDASGTMTLAGTVVEGQANSAIFMAGRGFRGGSGVQATTNGNDSEWRSTANANGIKGEGIAGTPRLLAIKSNNFGAAVSGANLVTSNWGVQGYPNGDYARGAPGNAGGGGTEGTPAPGGSTRNAGGGGGGNYASGGLGGRPWNAPLNDTNGRGGAGYSGTLGFNRIFMGGGGAAGGTNNATADPGTYLNRAIGCSAGGGLCSSGAAGGGIVILRARQVGGSGIIDVRGAHGYNVLNDAAGGGGAGGTVVLQTTAGGSATVNASGGDGGNAWAGNTSGTTERHGPGGGGGGGFVVYSPNTFSLTSTLVGGVPGLTTNGANDTYGSSGSQGGLGGFEVANVPGVSPGADCFPDLRLAKSNGVNTLNNGDISTYTVTATNGGGGPSAGTITVVDVLPAGLTIADGAVVLGGAQAANWTCSAATNVLTCTSATVLAASASSVFSFVAQVTSVANGSSVTNRARIGGGGDLNKPVPDAASTGLCTGNNTPAGCAIDVDTVNAPLLSLVKTDNTDTVVTGTTTVYQLTVSNTGAAPSAGTLRVVDVLPTGMSYTGASPFTSGGFTCTYTAGTLSFVCESAAILPAGGSVVIAVPGTLAATTSSALTNRAQVGGGSDPGKLVLPTVATATACPAPVPPDDLNSNSATGCAADTNAVTSVTLSLEKDDGQPFMPANGQTTYEFVVRNTGTAASLGTIQFRDVLPAPMNWPATLVKAGTNALDWTCTRVSATVASCTSTTVIPAGGASVFSLVANVGNATVGAQLLNRARVGAGGDPVLLQSLADADVTACTNSNIPLGCAVDLNTVQNAAQIRLAKTHLDPQFKQPGDTVVFNLVVSNSGGTASGTAQMRVVDVLPAGLTYSGATPFNSGGFTCTHAAGTITCNRSTSLAAGASTTITFNAVVSTSAGSGTLVNRAQVAGGSDPQLGLSTTVTAATAVQCTGSAVPFLGCATDPVQVVLNANLSITKANTTSPVIAGGTVTYSIVVTNNGPASANGAVLRDNWTALPGLDCSAGPATCAASGTGGTQCPASVTPAGLQAGLAVPVLPNGGIVTFTLQCVVTATGQ